MTDEHQLPLVSHQCDHRLIQYNANARRLKKKLHGEELNESVEKLR